MMATDNGAKGNPAAKRMVNPKKKSQRSLSWQRGERRKLERVKRQQSREMANRNELEALETLGVRTRGDVRPSKALRLAKRELRRREEEGAAA